MSASSTRQGESFQSLRSEAFTTPRAGLQQDAMEYDRRQIRRHLFDKLRERGLDPHIEVFDADDELQEEESVYDDTETAPWRQRETAIQAAAIGGQTEARLEGFDSLERALHAYHHQIHYGRGSGFGWSQQNNLNQSLLNTQAKLQSMRRIADWSDFNDLSQHSDHRKGSKTLEGDFKGDGVDFLQSDKDKRKGVWRNRLFKVVLVLAVIGTTVWVGLYIQTRKIGII